jgi:hypothetical protein
LTIYGENPYDVNPDLFTDVTNAVSNKSIVGITPILQAPTVIELAMTVAIGASQNSYVDAQTARNLVNTAIATYISNLGIGKTMYNSALLATIQNVPGITYADVTFTVTSFATSAAGKIVIPIVENASMAACTLVDASNTVLFQGNGTSNVSAGSFTFVTAQDFPDQVCTLTYATSTTDVVLNTAQVIVLTSLDITTTLLNA